MMKYMLLLCNMFFIGNISFCQSTDPAVSATGIRFKSRLAMGWNDTDMVSLNSYDVYHAGNLTQYRLTTHFDSTENEKSLLCEDRYEYFVFNKDSTFGIRFNSHPDSFRGTNDRVQVDSAIYGHNDFMPTFDDEKGRAPDSSFWYASNRLVSIFHWKKRGRYQEDCSYDYYYSNEFKDVPEMYSKKFDTAKGLKLYKIVVHLHGAYYEQSKRAALERQCIYEMQRPSLEEFVIAERYFKKYRDLSSH